MAGSTQHSLTDRSLPCTPPVLFILQNHIWQVGILPATGGAIAFGRIRRRGGWADVLRPTPEADYGNPSACASFPLVPWSNRIKDATFQFNGKRYVLRATSKDGAALHGVGRNHPWAVKFADSTHVVLRFDTVGLRAQGKPVNFPWPFCAQIIYRLEGERFTIDTAMRNGGDEPFPGGFGHHPYFVRALSGQGDAAKLEIPCERHFPAKNGIPIGPPQPIPAHLDFRRLRPLEEVAIDDNLTGRIPGRPVLIVYPNSDVAICMTMAPNFENIILFTPLKKPYFAVEPVTNANNGFNLYADGVPGSGTFVLDPGQSARGVITLDVVHL